MVLSRRLESFHKIVYFEKAREGGIVINSKKYTGGGGGGWLNKKK